MKTTLISAAELVALPSDQVLVVDCRKDLVDPAKGRRDYLDGHIPGAVYAELDADLSDLSLQSQGMGRHPLPPAEAFSSVLGRWGWRPGLQVVAYDAASGALAAARLWWLLRSASERAVAVLDGGYGAWLVAGLPVETAVPLRTATTVAVRFEPAAAVLDHAALHAAPAPLLI
ncbi:MAG: sulfurtransferase, partial [Xanthomonadaceae bacterium]|nr:sulfurtransferase [Xanthomonadaceae bacterium]